MSDKSFVFSVAVIGFAFFLFFCVVVLPPALAGGDVMGAFAAGFVNPYAAGYSFDVIMCYFALVIWVLYERRNFGVKGGYICLALGIVPGVAVGMALYMIVRLRQLKTLSSDQ